MPSERKGPAYGIATIHSKDSHFQISTVMSLGWDEKSLSLTFSFYRWESRHRQEVPAQGHLELIKSNLQFLFPE